MVRRKATSVALRCGSEPVGIIDRVPYQKGGFLMVRYQGREYVVWGRRGHEYIWIEGTQQASSA